MYAGTWNIRPVGRKKWNPYYSTGIRVSDEGFKSRPGLLALNNWRTEQIDKLILPVKALLAHHGSMLTPEVSFSSYDSERITILLEATVRTFEWLKATIEEQPKRIFGLKDLLLLIASIEGRTAQIAVARKFFNTWNVMKSLPPVIANHRAIKLILKDRHKPDFYMPVNFQMLRVLPEDWFDSPRSFKWDSIVSTRLSQVHARVSAGTLSINEAQRVIAWASLGNQDSLSTLLNTVEALRRIPPELLAEQTWCHQASRALQALEMRELLQFHDQATNLLVLVKNSSEDVARYNGFHDLLSGLEFPEGVTQLKRAAEFIREGDEQRHCVGIYWKQTSMWVFAINAHGKRSTLSVFVDGTAEQHQAKANTPPHASHVIIADQILKIIRTDYNKYNHPR